MGHSGFLSSTVGLRGLGSFRVLGFRGLGLLGVVLGLGFRVQGFRV